MTVEVLRAMDLCRPFRRAPDHVLEIEARIDSLKGKRQAIGKVIEHLLGRGLLIRDTDYRDWLRSPPQAEPAPARAVFIRACDRPDQLARLLDTLAQLEKRIPSSRRYVVLDDSRKRESAARNRDALAEFTTRTGREALHFGDRQREEFARRLVRECPDQAESINWLLGTASEAAEGFSGGRNFNLALLLMAGARGVLLDEDFVLPARLAGLDTRLDVSGDLSTSLRFVPRSEGFEQLGLVFEGDPIAAHLDACGKPFGALYGRHPLLPEDASSLLGLMPSQLDPLSPDAFIISSAGGVYGNSPSDRDDWWYTLDAESRADLWRSRDDYLAALDKGLLWRCAAHASLRRQGNFTPFALDGSRLLPFTGPTERGEDAFFAAAMRFCHPRALNVELPLAIGHFQEAGRAYAPPRDALTPKFHSFMANYLGQRVGDYHARDPALRLEAIGYLCVDLADAGPAANAELVAEYLAAVRADYIRRLQAQLSSLKEPPVYWMADARERVQINGRALAQPGAPRLGGWPSGWTEAQCGEAINTRLHRYARAARDWPTIWQAAAALGERALNP